MFSVSGSKAFYRSITRVAFVPLLSLSITSHADSNTVGDRSTILSLQSAFAQHWIPPATSMEGHVMRHMPGRPIVAAPEPYSFLLATVGVFGMLAMGTLFRKRIKSEQQPPYAKRFGIRNSKYKAHHNSLAGRSRLR